jgi:hypothetical protein
MFGDRLSRYLGPIAVVLAVLAVIGLIGLIMLRSNGPDRDLAAIRTSLEPGDRARVAGAVEAVIPLGPAGFALALTDGSTHDHPLLVLSGDPNARGTEGEKVSVNGTIERLAPDVTTRYGLSLADARLRRYVGEIVVVADSLGAKSESIGHRRS